ncbi:MAG TPA: sortase, partial [Actinomycetales bacterium]|nr:sortase [Actinomycetales bacterium]
DQVLSYQVIEMLVIEPDETEAIFADPTRDLITLVTCTPLGINSHRILVTAERVTPTPQDQLETAFEPPDLPGFPWWTVILGGVVTGLSVYVWRAGYQAPRVRKGAGAAGSAPRESEDDDVLLV